MALNMPNMRLTYILAALSALMLLLAIYSASKLQWFDAGLMGVCAVLGGVWVYRQRG